MRDIAKEVGVLIKSHRKEAGLSQEALALKAGIARAYVGRLERGEFNITIKTLWDIAEAIGISAKDLIPD